MPSPHPFTIINPGDLISITGWSLRPNMSGEVINLPFLDPKENYAAGHSTHFLRLKHAETVVGFVVKKEKIKQREFIQVLVKDKIVVIGRGWCHNANFSIGKITTGI